MTSGALPIQGLHEQRYKLRLRCTSCAGEAHVPVTLGMTSMSPQAVANRLREMAAHVPFVCPCCDGTRKVLAAYFPTPRLDDIEIFADVHQ